MRNIKLTIEYDGTNYAGWQRQNSRQSSVVSRQPKTIQETIERTLQKILQEKVKLIGSGRTDAGVHAEGQVANFKTSSSITTEKLRNPPPEKMSNKPNSWLLFNKLRKSVMAKPGIGTWARMRVITKSPPTIKMRLRKSLTFQICDILDINHFNNPPIDTNIKRIDTNLVFISLIFVFIRGVHDRPLFALFLAHWLIISLSQMSKLWQFDHPLKF